MSVRHVFCPGREAPFKERRINVAYIRCGEPRRWVPVGRLCRGCGRFWSPQDWPLEWPRMPQHLEDEDLRRCRQSTGS